MVEQRSLWRDGVFEPVNSRDSAGERIAVADSWLVRDGNVLGLELHRNRFAKSVEETGWKGGVDVDGFWSAVVGSLPRTGQWFPRVELFIVGEMPQLGFLLRRSPRLSRVARLITHSGSDFRTVPAIKGPDLDAMIRARSDGQKAGADEVILVSTDGHIIDGTSTAILWWRDGAIFSPPLSRSRVDSITARTINIVARATGIDVGSEDARPDDLSGCVIWAVNALHGIRAVTAWIDGPPVTQDDQLTRAWRSRLRALERPI